MNSNDLEKQSFEVALKVNREPLPPYYETVLNNLTYMQAVEIINILESYGKSVFILYKQ